MFNYPENLVSTVILTESITVSIRPVRPDDAELIQAFVRGLSPHTKHADYMENFTEFSPDTLKRLTQINYGTEMVLIATHEVNGQEVMIGLAHYSPDYSPEVCDSVVVIADAWQGKGLANHLMEQLFRDAKAKGFKMMQGEILASNIEMLNLAKYLGFEISSTEDSTVKCARKSLS